MEEKVALITGGTRGIGKEIAYEFLKRGYEVVINYCSDEAAALGLRVKGFRTGMLLLCSVMVASLVSVTGVIGFVGLVVPHVVRLLAGSSDNRVVLPLSGLLGAVYLMWADTLARSGFGAAELPLGVITAFVGAPFFLFLMLRSGWRDGVR